MDESKVINVPGEFSELEEAILDLLYNNPNSNYGTGGLVRELRPEPPDGSDEQKAEQQKQAFHDVQYGIETLIVAKHLKGKRQRAFNGDVYFEELKLTPSGEAAAIKQKRRLKKIVISSNRPPRENDEG